MKKGTVATLAVIGVIILSLIGLRIWVYDASGVDPPFTVVVSESMQHSHDSEIGVIDTGDMILLRSTDEHEPVTYVEGYTSGYRMFGEYGDVIVYERTDENQVIHRAILYLELNSDGTFTGVGLENYVDGNGEALWRCDGCTADSLSGTLYLYDIGYAEKDVSIDLGLFSESGYLTMGDNGETNLVLDQYQIGGDDISQGIVTNDRVKATAWVEIPWVGAVKLTLNGNDASLQKWAPSSLSYLTASIVSFILIIVALGYLLDAFRGRKAFRGGH